VRESEPWNTYFDYLAPEIRSVAYGAFGYPHRIVFVADATRRSWEPVKRCDNFTTIHNSLDADRLQRREGSRDRSSVRTQLRIDPAEVVISLVGTVCERKGQLDLVRAFRLLPEQVASRARLFIVGDRASAYSRQLHEETAALPPGRAARVVIVRETGEPYLYFQAADIALCCSRIESYPRVTLEAMAFGLPIVTTPVFGIVEQVQEGVNALFYVPGDVAQLASQLARLITDDTLRGSMGSQSGRVLNDLPSQNDMLAAYGRVFAEAARMRDESFAARAAAE